MQADFPLFPLPLVATPHSRTALQIFEPRYLDLIKRQYVCATVLWVDHA